ncbi:hypothetical protein [Tessaracoccus aquimaris]|uniref:hypothetical protein n=1 Tax=Tessaracoccus aquimaris TaxID=1332264 RepID=UPI0011AB5048|nr:hypothetical protein [Tessaracoccus aquimaris]
MGEAAPSPVPSPHSPASPVPASPASPTPGQSMPASEPVPEPTPTPKVPPMVVDDLATGSAEHQFKAGAMVVTADYWSDRGKADWTPGTVKPLTLNVSADGRGDLTLASVNVQVERLSLDGWVAVPSDVVTQPVVSATPDIKGPSSASATVLVNAVDPASYGLRYTIVYTVTSSSGDADYQAVGNDTVVVTFDGNPG